MLRQEREASYGAPEAHDKERTPRGRDPLGVFLSRVPQTTCYLGPAGTRGITSLAWDRQACAKALWLLRNTDNKLSVPPKTCHSKRVTLKPQNSRL